MPGSPPLPKQVLTGGTGTLHTVQGRPVTASRSVLCRRDFWAGNGSSQTDCQRSWREGREPRIWESTPRKPSSGERVEDKCQRGSRKRRPLVYLHIKADSLIHSADIYSAPTQRQARRRCKQRPHKRTRMGGAVDSEAACFQVRTQDYAPSPRWPGNLFH